MLSELRGWSLFVTLCQDLVQGFNRPCILRNWCPEPGCQFSVCRIGTESLQLCNWLKRNPNRLLLLKGNRQCTGGEALYARRLEERWHWSLSEDANNKMVLRRDAVGSDLGTVLFQSTKNVTFVLTRVLRLLCNTISPLNTKMVAPCLHAVVVCTAATDVHG